MITILGWDEQVWEWDINSIELIADHIAMGLFCTNINISIKDWIKIHFEKGILFDKTKVVKGKTPMERCKSI